MSLSASGLWINDTNASVKLEAKQGHCTWLLDELMGHNTIPGTNVQQILIANSQLCEIDCY